MSRSYRPGIVERALETVGVFGDLAEEAVYIAGAAEGAVELGAAVYYGYKWIKGKRYKVREEGDIPETDDEADRMGWWPRRKAKSRTQSAMPGVQTGEQYVKAKQKKSRRKSARKGRQVKRGNAVSLAQCIKQMPKMLYLKAERYISYLSEADFQVGRMLLPSILKASNSVHYLPCQLYELTTMPGYEGYLGGGTDHKWNLVWNYGVDKACYEWLRNGIPCYTNGGGGDGGFAAMTGPISAPVENAATTVACGGDGDSPFVYRMHCTEATPEMLRLKDRMFLRDCVVDLQLYPVATHDVTYRIDLVSLNDDRGDPETLTDGTISREELQPPLEGLIRPYTQASSMLPVTTKPDKLYKFLKTWTFKVGEAIVDTVADAGAAGTTTGGNTLGVDKLNSVKTRLKIPISRMITNKMWRSGPNIATAGGDSAIFNALGPEYGGDKSRLNGNIYYPYQQITGTANTDTYVIDANGRPVGSKKQRLYLMIRANVERATAYALVDQPTAGVSIPKLTYPTYNMTLKCRWLADKRSEGATVVANTVMD